MAGISRGWIGLQAANAVVLVLRDASHATLLQMLDGDHVFMPDEELEPGTRVVLENDGCFGAESTPVQYEFEALPPTQIELSPAEHSGPARLEIARQRSKQS